MVKGGINKITILFYYFLGGFMILAVSLSLRGISTASPLTPPTPQAVVQDFYNHFEIGIAFNPTDDSRIFSLDLQNVVAEVDAFMTHQGFTLDSQNASPNFRDSQFIDFVHGFTNGNTIL